MDFKSKAKDIRSGEYLQKLWKSRINFRKNIKVRLVWKEEKHLKTIPNLSRPVMVGQRGFRKRRVAIHIASKLSDNYSDEIAKYLGWIRGEAVQSPENLREKKYFLRRIHREATFNQNSL